jgi:hypothetical protein
MGARFITKAAAFTEDEAEKSVEMMCAGARDAIRLLSL